MTPKTFNEKKLAFYNDITSALKDVDEKDLLAFAAALGLVAARVMRIYLPKPPRGNKKKTYKEACEGFWKDAGKINTLWRAAAKGEENQSSESAESSD